VKGGLGRSGGQQLGHESGRVLPGSILERHEMNMKSREGIKNIRIREAVYRLSLGREE
jgi:hypothetical protein